MSIDDKPDGRRLAPSQRANGILLLGLFLTAWLECHAFIQHWALSTFYFGPGLMLGTLYCLDRPGRRSMFLAMLLALGAGYAAAGLAPANAVLAALAFGAQAWIGATVLRKVAPNGLDLTRAGAIGKVVLMAVLVAPPFGFVIETLLVKAHSGIIFPDQAPGTGAGGTFGAGMLLRWVLPHVLGIVLATPVTVSFCAYSRGRQGRWWNLERVLVLTGVVVLTALVFYSDGRTYLFLICPLLVWTGLRLGIRDTASAIIISLATASIAAAHGHGPVEVLNIAPAQRGLFLELAYLCAYGCILPIAASLETRRQLEGRLAQSLEFTEQILRNMHEVVLVGNTVLESFTTLCLRPL